MKLIRVRAVAIFFTLILAAAISSYAQSPTIVVQWNQAVLQGVRDSTLGPPMVARALAIVHTCAYDAWAAYDKHAVGTQLGGQLRRPTKEHTLANKNKAISFAAYRAAVDLLPGDKVKVSIGGLTKEASVVSVDEKAGKVVVKLKTDGKEKTVPIGEVRKP